MKKINLIVLIFFAIETFGCKHKDSGISIPTTPAPTIKLSSVSPVSVKEEFFGMHVGKRANDWLPGITVKTVRSHDMENGKGRWKFINPNRGVYDWKDLDSWVLKHHTAGRDMIFVLFGTPHWASARPTEIGAYGSGNPGIQAEPADMVDWDTFCTAVAKRYLGKIKYYEVWNEPNLHNNGITTTGPSFFFSGTFAKLSEMVRRANQAIKAVDPTAQIICPATTIWSATAGQSTEKYFAGMMAASDGAGGTMKDWVDIVGVHLYLPTPNKIQDLPGMIDRVNAAKTAAGVSSKETWETESAPISPTLSTYSDSEAMKLIARSMLIMAARGITRTCYYTYDSPTFGFSDRQPIKEYREQIVKLLIGGTILSVWQYTDGRVAYYTASGMTVI